MKRVRVRTVKIEDQRNRPVLVIELGDAQAIRTVNPIAHECQRHVTRPWAGESPDGRAFATTGASSNCWGRRGASNRRSFGPLGGATGQGADQHEEGNNGSQPGSERRPMGSHHLPVPVAILTLRSAAPAGAALVWHGNPAAVFTNGLLSRPKRPTLTSHDSYRIRATLPASEFIHQFYERDSRTPESASEEQEISPRYWPYSRGRAGASC